MENWTFGKRCGSYAVLYHGAFNKKPSTCTWSTWMSIIKALRLHEASCSCSRKVWTNSGASGIRKSKFLRTKQVKMSLQVMVWKKKKSTRHVFVSTWNSSFLDQSLWIEDKYPEQARTTCKWAMQTQVHSCSDASMPQHWQCLRRVTCFRQGKIFFVGQCCRTILSDTIKFGLPSHPMRVYK